MKEFISNSLIHWTGRNKSEDEAFSILVNIVSTHLLLLSYCHNYSSNVTNNETAMVCFTDIPLSLSKEHCSRFGRFGIAFNKDIMINYGANPVLYTTTRFEGQVRDLYNLLDHMLDREKDREWKEELEPYHFTPEQLYSFLELIGLSQEYIHNGRDINYYQREWRINYKSLINIPGQDSDRPGHGGIYGNRNGKIIYEMRFSLSDIDFIVIPKQFYERRSEISNHVNCEIKIYEVEVEKKWWRRWV